MDASSSLSVRDSCLSASTFKFAGRQASGANVGFPSALRPLSPRRCGLSLSPTVGNLSFCYLSHSRRNRSTKTGLVLNGSSSTFEVNEESREQGLQVAESARARVEPVATGPVAWSADGKATILWPTRKQTVKAASGNEEQAELTGKVDAQGGNHVPSGGEHEDFFLPNNRQSAARLADTIPKRPSTPRRQQSDMWTPSSASRLLIGAPAFKQDAELDGLTASIRRIQEERSSFILSDSNQFPSGGQVHDVPLHKEDTRQGKSVFPSKLEGILNDFRSRHQREERWRKQRTSKNNPDSMSQEEGGFSSPSSTRRSASTLNSSSSWKFAGRDQQSANHGSPINAKSSEEFFDAMEDRGKVSNEKGGFTMSHQNNSHVKTSHEPLDQLNSSISTPRRSRRGSVSFIETHSSIRNRSPSSGEEQAAKYSGMRSNSTNSNVKSKGKVWVNDKPRLLAREETTERAIKNDLKKYPQRQMSRHRGENFDQDGSVNTASHIESDTEADCPCPIQSKQSTAGLKPDEAEPLIKGGKAAWHSQSNSSLPFEYQFSYSEVPNAPVLRYREKPYSPFGPQTMSRPWTGGPPLEKNKKNRPMFDSFNPPPKGQKGVKYVQDPGPYPLGQGPKPAKSRDEILGEPLTNSEIAMLIDSCQEEKRQLNLGRDGLTHNMLDLIHCHWKRRRVIKVRCLSVPTVDMDNLCFHLEDKTGGKIVYRSGGNVYLFRGRNYNYKDRPEIPLMLWRPISPVYPRLIKRAPTGLTEKEADQLRELGMKVEPLCKLNKNGIYHKLVEDVRVAFKVDKLVRIDCRGLNPSDYKKIGAKLKDLVPCVLLSFDNEQILMWKGKEPSTDSESSKTSAAEALSEESPVIDAGSTSVTRDLEDDDTHVTRALHCISHSKLTKDEIASEDSVESNLSASSEAGSSKAFTAKGKQDINEPNLSLQDSCIRIDDDMAWDGMMGNTEGMPGDTGIETGNHSELTFWTEGQEKDSAALQESVGLQLSSMGLDDMESVEAAENLSDTCNAVHFEYLWDQAITSGIAVELEDAEMDNDTIVTRARNLAGEVPPGEPYTRNLIRNLQIKSPSIAHPDQELHKHMRKIKRMKLERKITRRRSFRTQHVGLQDLPQDGPRHSGMDVDELAQLLSMR